MKKITPFSSLLFFLTFASTAMGVEEGQKPPLNHYIIGDSISRGFMALFPSENPFASWVTGSHSSIDSIEKQLNSIYGSNRVTTNDSDLGARLVSTLKYRLSSNAEALSQADYITIQLGANDICSIGEFAGIEELPTADEIYEATYEGLHNLLGEVEDGTTIELVAIPDVGRIYDIGQNKKALGFISCPLVWNIVNTVIPDLLCPSVTGSNVSEEDRNAVRQLNVAYNNAIAQAVEDIQVEIEDPSMSLPNAFPVFNDASFFEFDANHVSTWDCFHPSFQGQRELAKRLWKSGPFFE